MSAIGKGMLLYGDETGGTNMRFVTFCKDCCYAELVVPSASGIWCNYYALVMDKMDYCSRGKENQ